MQGKIALAGGAALLAWLLSRSTAAAPRVTKELDIDANVLSPYFGMTDAEIAAAKAAGAGPNPAIDPEMRRLIDISNAVIAADDD